MRLVNYLNEEYGVPGLELNPKDKPPEIVNGNYIFYHGTTAKTAQMIISNRILKATKGWGIGITTTYVDAEPYALMKSMETKDKKAVLRIELDKEWLDKQTIRREVGGHGVNQFLIQGDIPASAVKNIKVLNQREISKFFKTT